MPPAAKEKDIPEEIIQTWDPNPVVVISKRPCSFRFPNSVLLRAPTEDELTRWSSKDEDNRASSRDEKTVHLHAGVTFLGTYSTSWALKNINSHKESPAGAPHFDRCVLLTPRTDSTTTTSHHSFRDPASRKILGTKVHEAWMRVMAYLKEQDRRLLEAGIGGGVWNSPGGLDTPDVFLIRLGEAFKLGTELGQAAHGAITAAIPWVKDPATLGAFHDYACRNANTYAAFADKCRTRGRAWRDLMESP